MASESSAWFVSWLHEVQTALRSIPLDVSARPRSSTAEDASGGAETKTDYDAVGDAVSADGKAGKTKPERAHALRTIKLLLANDQQGRGKVD